MPPTEGFKDFIRDQLAGFGPVSIRNMFGGAGIYADGVMFAIPVDDMSYWEVPPRLLEEPEELAAWARKAHRIACASKRNPSRKKLSGR
jgi:DNA transformation protein